MELASSILWKEEPVTVAYFYKVKWGYQNEFLELYKKNHYPVLEAMVKSGRLVAVQTWTPRFHGDGRSDWTFMSVFEEVVISPQLVISQNESRKHWSSLDSCLIRFPFVSNSYPFFVDSSRGCTDSTTKAEMVEPYFRRTPNI